MNSAEQLAQDFGHYPPIPLSQSNAIAKVNFSILYQGKFLRFFNAARTMFAMFSFFSDADTQRIKGENADSITAMIQQFRLLKEPVKNSFLQLVSVINSKNIASRIVLRILLTLLVLLLLPIALFFIIYKAFKLLLLISKKLGKSYGYYSILPKKVPVIFFNTDNLSKLKVLHDAAISHEHIHVLQHCIGSNVIGSVDMDKHLQFADSILKDADKGDPYIHYLMQRNETEARLHEIVLSYYRVVQKLPTSYQGFIELICRFGAFYNVFVVKAGSVVARLSDGFLPIDELEVREQHFFMEFYCILRGMVNEEMLTRYTLEVMPMLYSNLLLLYAGEAARETFIKTIPCSDMYHALYPKLTVSSDDAPCNK